MQHNATSFCYAPLLKWKRGEQNALKALDKETRATIKPIVNLLPKDILGPKTPVPQVYDDPIFVSIHDTCSEMLGSRDLNTAYIRMCRKADGTDSKCVPVISLTYPAALISSIANLARELGNGLAIRCQYPFNDAMTEACIAISQRENIPLSQIDVILDVGLIDSRITSFFGEIANRVILCNIPGTRNCVVAAGSFPEQLPAAYTRPDGEALMPRLEKELFKKIQEKDSSVIFGDYGCDDPNDLVAQTKSIIATVKYTISDGWKILRGHRNDFDTHDYAQFHELSRKIVNSDYYSGSAFSMGDSEILQCAEKVCSDKKCNHGNPETWVKRSVNHHITFVARECANLP